MADSYYDIEERIQEAPDWQDENPEVKLSEIARQSSVPYSRLYAQSKGRPATFEQYGHDSRLNQYQDDAICSYIDRLSAAYLPPRKDIVVM